MCPHSPNDKNSFQDQKTDFESEENKFLIFSLDQELYGCCLLEIREVIKLGEIKKVPYMVHYFKGVINLRGQIVSIIDLREKFDVPIENQHEGLILVVEAKEGLIGVIVDDIISVENIFPGDIEKNPVIETKIPAQFLLGIGKHKDRLINLIYLSNCISADEMRSISKVVNI